MSCPLAARLLAAVLLAALAAPAGAAADFQTLYDDYRGDGSIDGCSYTTAELEAGLADTPADVREYDPDFTGAINFALERLAGGCETQDVSPQNNGAAATAKDGSPRPPTDRPPPLSPPDDDRGLPAVLVAVVGVLAASLLGAALLLASRRFGWGLERRAAFLARPLRALRERLADGVWAARDRLGF